MKQMAITDKELIAALRRMAPETGSLICLGCGHERSCNIHGCAVLQAAVRRLEELTASPPNNPLALEELREMDGEPVWIKFLNCPEADGWALVCAGRESVEHSVVGLCDFAESGKTWLAYRRKQEKVSQPPVEPTVPDWAAHLRARFLRAE